ncbi:hypothetical protein IFM89_038021 [Coptis chinensis]|uniref:Germin-like protein n=1 Tax=Coptis chinensis TaxID=261450 RepID=A0A835HV43_9MAGN|nr:hypothetical protein IFM89_038021 [Coptis chinensis]
MATKQALEDALVHEKELEAYVDKKKKKKNKLKKLLNRRIISFGEGLAPLIVLVNNKTASSSEIVRERRDCASVFVNGKFCKDPKLATANDFFFSGLHMPGNTSNQLGSAITPANVAQIPGLNTLGISLARVDFAPYGLTSPHTHPRATEIVVVVEGTLYVGFVTSNPDNRFITKVLYQGDVFVIPVGLIHFGSTPSFVGKYVTPNHMDINGNGIEPDYRRIPDGGSCKTFIAGAIRKEWIITGFTA